MFVNGRAQTAPFAPTFLDRKISQDVPWVTLDPQNVVQFAHRSFSHLAIGTHSVPMRFSRRSRRFGSNASVFATCRTSLCESKLATYCNKVVDEKAPGGPAGSGTGRTVETHGISLPPKTSQLIDEMRGSSSRGVFISVCVYRQISASRGAEPQSLP